jgi:hypothetical protein
VDTPTIPPAGDPFTSAPQRHPHGCYDGFVYIGHVVEDEFGDEVEVIERVPCRRCRLEAAENL